MNFAEYKKQKEKLKKATDKIKDEKPSFADDRLWKPTPDKANFAEALIRFLPQPNMENEPVVKHFHHFIQEGNKYYIEPCLTNWQGEDGKDLACPACEYFFSLREELFEQGMKEDDVKKATGKYVRKTDHYANILVKRDPHNSDAEGKVFIYKFGMGIMKKINEKLYPKSELDEPINIFCMEEGADFRLKIDNAGKRDADYSSSSFLEKTGIACDEDKFEEVWNNLHSLEEWTDRSKVKSYDELKKSLYRVVKRKLNDDSESEKSTENLDDVFDGDDFEEPESKPEKETPKQKTVEKEEKKKPADDDMGVMDDLDGFDDSDFDDMLDEFD
jgi:hypothetical protein